MQAPLQVRNDAEAAQTDTARTVAQKPVLVDKRPEALAQRKLAEMMNNSPRVLQQRMLSDAIHNSPRMVAQRHQMNALFGGAVKPQEDGAMPAKASPTHLEEKTNNTGLPNRLKSGIELLSGMSMGHVKVHYNSDKPAQLQAHAYAQGNEIHFGAGQERHLPHEAWHVVQQAQGRVRPTLQMMAGAVNDDPSMEKEADMMGEKATQFEGEDVARNLVAEERVAGAVTQRVAGIANGAKTIAPQAQATQAGPVQDQTIAQLARTNVMATGVTHLVRLNGKGSLYQRNFMDNEVAETKAGDSVLLETDDRLRSRRGANQEQNPERDALHDRDQWWIGALAFNEQRLPPHSYMRAGTFSEARVEKRIPAADNGARASLLLPYSVPSGGKVYMIEASHRGDMYHMRAAMAVEQHPVVIYNFAGPNDLSNYLAKAPGAQVYLLPYNPVKPKAGDHVDGLVYRSLEILSESDATRIAASAPDKAANINASMTSLPVSFIAPITDAVTAVFEGCSSKSALLMYRDSGQKGLVYPELDSGAALPELGRLMREKGYDPVLCGAPPEAEFGFHNIGAYWEKLEAVPHLAGLLAGDHRALKRDIEAEFMRQAYREKKFAIVVGFRSGALDLFTFLGIPTISISLKNLVGEDRHQRFVGHRDWKRTNVQYDMPRSEVTRMMLGRGDSTLYMSPYWKMRGAGAVAEESAAASATLMPESHPTTASAPGNFDPLDIETISAGLDIGIAKLRSDKSETRRVEGVVTRDSVMEILPESLREIKSNHSMEMNSTAEIEDLLKGRFDQALQVYSIHLRQRADALPADKAATSRAQIPAMLEKEKEAYSKNMQDVLKRREENARRIASKDDRDAVAMARARKKALKKESKKEASKAKAAKSTSSGAESTMKADGESD